MHIKIKIKIRTTTGIQLTKIVLPLGPKGVKQVIEFMNIFFKRIEYFRIIQTAVLCLRYEFFTILKGYFFI